MKRLFNWLRNKFGKKKVEPDLLTPTEKAQTLIDGTFDLLFSGSGELGDEIRQEAKKRIRFLPPDYIECLIAQPKARTLFLEGYVSGVLDGKNKFSNWMLNS